MKIGRGMPAPDEYARIDAEVSEFMVTADVPRPDIPDVPTTKEWMDSDPEGMKVMVADKLSELYHDRTVMQQQIRDWTLEYVLSDKGFEAWLRHEYPVEEKQKELALLQKQINRFKWMENYLNPADKITDDDIEQARRVPMENYLPALKPAGSGKLKCCCPFHEERTASFTVYTEENRWHCYGACSTGGSVIDYVMEKDKLTFLEAVKSLLGK